MISMKPAVKRQLTAAFTCSIAVITTGCMIGWPAPTLEMLREPESPIHLTKYEEAWMVNAMYYGMIISPLPSGYIMNKLGRKNSLLVLNILAIISWILVYFSTSASLIVVARLFAGLWMGGSQTVVPIYTAEISQPHVRGIFGTFYLLTSCTGSNVVYIVGPYVSIQTMAIFCGVLSVMFFILFSLCPESPYGHIIRNKNESAERSLSWLREGESIEAELELIKTSVREETESKDRKVSNLVTVAANRKAFIIVEIINMLERLSGISCMKAYSSVILPRRLGPLTSDHCMIIIGFVWMFSAFICARFVDRAGRKCLLYVSGWGIGISMLWTGVWYFLNDQTTIDVSQLNWLTLLGFVVFGITFSIGLGPVAKIYQGELFPSNLKGPASALTTMNAAFWSTVSTWLFTFLDQNVGMYMNFFVFAAVGVVTLLFTYYYAIETKGKSLQVIQAELMGEETEKWELVGHEHSIGYGTVNKSGE